MKFSNPLIERLGIETPVLQAPMAGVDTAALAAAVSDAGGLGALGCAYRSAEQIEETTRGIRARTNRAFGVNLFAPLEKPPAPTDTRRAVERVAPFYGRLGLTPPESLDEKSFDFERQLEAVLESGARVLSFTFGLMPPRVIEAARARDMLVMGAATTVREAKMLEESGVDAVIAQGAEAGGHRGSFAVSFESGMIGGLSLIPQVADAISIPVIASGGIADGRGLAAALLLGASAAQIGTAFLATEESGAPGAYKAALLQANEDETRITRAFSGRPARGVANEFMTAIEQDAGPGGILPFPYQNALTRQMRAEAGKRGDATMLSLWAGQGLRLARAEPAAEVARAIAEDAWRLLSAGPPTGG